MKAGNPAESPIEAREEANAQEFVGSEDAPSFFADAINVSSGIYGMSLHFGIRGARGVATRTRVTGSLHMSPQLAKVLALIMLKQVRSYEQDIGSLAIPEELARQSGILDELRRFEQSK